MYKTFVNKEGELYNAWRKIDFNQQNENGTRPWKTVTDKNGFNLDKTIDKYPIPGKENLEEKEKLAMLLEKDRVQQTFEIDGKQEKRLIEENPEFKDLNVYDMKGVLLRTNQSVSFTGPENNTFVKKESLDNSKELTDTKQQDQKKGKQNSKENQQDVQKEKKKSRGMKL